MNYTVYNDDPEVLKTLAEEYRSMGRDTKVDGNRLTVYAYAQKKQVAKKPERPKRKFDRDA